MSIWEQIESITPKQEANEILGRISELEQIITLSENRDEKWKAAKEILKWTADKGVDVAIALLPLFLKLG